MTKWKKENVIRFLGFSFSSLSPHSVPRRESSSEKLERLLRFWFYFIFVAEKIEGR